MNYHHPRVRNTEFTWPKCYISCNKFRGTRSAKSDDFWSKQGERINWYKKYYNLINSGYTSCQAFHEAMKLLTIINPHIKLSEVSQKTFNIIYPIYDNYYENNIDNHSQN